jgi:hypothetical protein
MVALGMTLHHHHLQHQTDQSWNIQVEFLVFLASATPLPFGQ